MNKLFALVFSFLFCSLLYAQNDTLRVLFLGNSYTYYNNLPSLTQLFSASTNKTLIVDSNTPGGYTLDLHSRDSSSLSKISQGNWDAVVLQEQSQIPTIDFYRYSSMYPSCKRINDSIKKYNPCARVILYMTWGRRFGGQQCDNGNVNCSPVFTDFNHMQDSLESAYLALADTIYASVAPVGISWKNILNDTTFVLHTADNSHPAYLGSYIAAATFYQILWNQSADSSSFQGSLSYSTSSYLKKVVDSTINNSILKWRLNQQNSLLNFSSTILADSAVFTNLSQQIAQSSWLWLFGDGDSASTINASHKYANSGMYTVSLIREHCGERDTLHQSVLILPTTLIEKQMNSFFVSPNPFLEYVTIQFDQMTAREVMVYNQHGKLQKRLQLLGQRQVRIDLSELPRGIYFLRTRTVSGEEQAIKLLKN